jgi:hypothetical protein
VPHRTGQAEHLRPGLACPAQGGRTTRTRTRHTTRHDTERHRTHATHDTTRRTQHGTRHDAHNTAHDTMHTTRHTTRHTRRDHVRLTKDSSEDGRSGCHLLRLPSPGALVQSPVRPLHLFPDSLRPPHLTTRRTRRTRHSSLTSHDTRHDTHDTRTHARTRTTRKWVE